MKIIHGLRYLKRQPKGSVITIGVFDGVHTGHKKIIKEAAAAADKARLANVVITFDPHPARVLRLSDNAPSLISLRHRARLIAALGAAVLVVIKFTRAFARTSPESFVKNVLVDKLRVREIRMGGDFHFGRDADAGAGILRKFSKPYNYKVTVIKPVKRGGRVVSSSLIRRFITDGKLSGAAKLLGRPVSVLGTIVKGSGLAKGLGYPTANINPHHEVIPPRGVYAVIARIGGKKIRGALNIGFRPTFYSSRDKEPTIEVHLFDFKGNLYGKDIEVYFIKKIRDEVRFKSAAALTAQIRKDMRAVQNALQSMGSVLI
ncbi:MAG: bifunctional riboflavin kinase/FAD synthetase [Candidatus Omnitrophota bacterium]